MYLQQQKLVWSVRLYKKVGSAEHIYNSRNQCGLLDRIKETSISSVSTIVEISVVCQTPNSDIVCNWIYNSRNQCGLLDLCKFQSHRLHLQQQKLVWSVRQASRAGETSQIYNSRNQCGLLDRILLLLMTHFYLQQQKLVWSVRLLFLTIKHIRYLQQQKLVWSVRPTK